MSVPLFPVLGERNAESRVLQTPERREGLTPGYLTRPAGTPQCGSPGFGAGAPTTQREIPSSAGLAPRLGEQQQTSYQPGSGITP